MNRAEAGGAEDLDAPKTPTRVKLPAASMIEPWFYGDGCVGLSGLYAALNGIRLVSAYHVAFDVPQICGLLNVGLRFMDGRLSPMRATTSGLRVGLWRQLVEALTHHARDRYQTLVFADRIHLADGTKASAWDAIEKAIDLRRAVLLLMRGGRYTVVSGYTSSSFLLFDGGGGRWLARRACGVPREDDCKRHLLVPSSMISLRA